VDGRLDHLIRIKDFPGIEIGDYNIRDPEIEGYQNRILTTADDADEFEIAEEGAISRNYEIMTKKMLLKRFEWRGIERGRSKNKAGLMDILRAWDQRARDAREKQNEAV